MSVEDHVIEVLTSKKNRSWFTDVTKNCSSPQDFDKNCLLKIDEIQELIQKSMELIQQQPMLLELTAPVTICGDIHGQFLDLLWVFDCGQYPPATNYLFLGDFVDRGKYSLEVAALLMAYKIKYPNRFFFLRGNHECNTVNESYGFKTECLTRFSNGEELWNDFGELFRWLPAAAVVGGKIFCVHGGLSPQLKTLDHIRRVPRPIETPVAGLLCDLVWSDPDKASPGWRYNDARAISYRFGPDVIAQFLNKFKLQLIVRAHELMQYGYEIIGDKQLITIFSAPNYTGVYGNNGAIFIVDEDLNCTITIMDYRIKKDKRLRTCENRDFDSVRK